VLVDSFKRNLPGSVRPGAGSCIVAYMETILGPWFVAAYHGNCADCGSDIEPDEEIRADGEGGYLCRDCGEDAEDG
jgi:hypothetical protein